MLDRMKTSTPRRDRSSAASPRVARRRQRMRQALLAAGARKFAERGVATVSVEELIAEADVSRATFYGFFEDKYSLLRSIVEPIFDVAVGVMEGLTERPAAEAFEGVLDTYLDLWQSHRDGLMLIPAIDLESFPDFKARHQALNDAMLEVLAKAERADLLRNGSARYSLKVMARTAIPLLRVYDDHPAAAALFRDAMRGLLIRSH
jgi:AcrR family transcriptional regulator